jgi:hypothetical protein
MTEATISRALEEKGPAQQLVALYALAGAGGDEARQAVTEAARLTSEMIKESARWFVCPEVGEKRPRKVKEWWLLQVAKGAGEEYAAEFGRQWEEAFSTGYAKTACGSMRAA